MKHLRADITIPNRFRAASSTGSIRIRSTCLERYPWKSSRGGCRRRTSIGTGPDLFGKKYRATAAMLHAIRQDARRVRTSALPPVSLVLVEPMLWTRFEHGAERDRHASSCFRPAARRSGSRVGRGGGQRDRRATTDIRRGAWARHAAALRVGSADWPVSASSPARVKARQFESRTCEPTAADGDQWWPSDRNAGGVHTRPYTCFT